MQLLLGLRDAWKCIQVGLEDGCTPCIGGKAVGDCNIEPAQWFKVRSAVAAASKIVAGSSLTGARNLY